MALIKFCLISSKNLTTSKHFKGLDCFKQFTPLTDSNFNVIKKINMDVSTKQVQCKEKKVLYKHEGSDAIRYVISLNVRSRERLQIKKLTTIT